VLDCHDWNLILMLDLRRFGRRSEPTKLETKLVRVSRVWCAQLGHRVLVTSFWWPVTWAENLGRVPWA